MEKVFFNRQLVFHTEMSDYSSSRQPVEEKNGAIYRLEELHNAKDTMQRCIQTAEMHEQDLCHKNKTNQLKAEMALQTFSHKAEMLKQKKKEATQKEEIRRQVSRRIEAINLMETVHTVESQRQDEQHKKETRRKELLQTEEMVKQVDWHRGQMEWLRGEHKAEMLNLTSLYEAEIVRHKAEIKRLQHCNPCTCTLITSILTFVGSVITFAGSVNYFRNSCDLPAG